MRGAIHHLDLTVRNPWASCDFYEAVLGFLGYRRVREGARAASIGSWRCPMMEASRP